MGSLACRADEIKALLENATYGLNALKTLLEAIEGSGFATGTDSLKILSDVLDLIKGSGFDTTLDSLKILSDVLDLIMGSGFATGADSLKIISDMLDTIRTELTFQHQADATLTQATPAQNTYYTILDTTLNCRIIGIGVSVATTGESLQLRLTIDGQVLVHAVTACAAGTAYRAYMDENGTLDLATTAYFAYRAFLVEGRSVKVEVQKTTANGTGTITGRVIHAKR